MFPSTTTGTIFPFAGGGDVPHDRWGVYPFLRRIQRPTVAEILV
jgi:hypothetical protein